MKPLALLALIPLVVAASQDDSERQREAKLKAIADWVGKWKVALELKDGPPELKGLKINGELDVKWDLDKTALRFDGWGKADPDHAGRNPKRITFTGLLTFNHVGPYAERGYSAVFTSSSDARVLLAKGEFDGRDLVMHTSIHPPQQAYELIARGVGSNPRRIVVHLAGPQSAKRQEWMRITLRRP